MTSHPPFGGAKLGLLWQDSVVVILRDDRPDIPWPGHWDFPGGGREGDETPAHCVLRELREELGLILSPDRLTHASYHASTASTVPSWFFLARLEADELADLTLGEEGQTWQVMAVADYLQDRLRISHLAERLAQALGLPAGASSGPDNPQGAIRSMPR